MHAVGVMHRDLHSDNILVAADRAVVADLGSAKKVVLGAWHTESLIHYKCVLIDHSSSLQFSSIDAQASLTGCIRALLQKVAFWNLHACTHQPHSPRRSAGYNQPKQCYRC
jgi:serine/threonine protein kinase